MTLDPQITGFALGLLLGAAKVGFVGTVGFGIGWWRSRNRVQQLEAAARDPGRLEDRLGHIEQSLDDTANQLAHLIEAQDRLSSHLLARPGVADPDPGASRTPA